MVAGLAVCMPLLIFTNLTIHAHVPLANLVGGLLRRWPRKSGPLFCEDQRRDGKRWTGWLPNGDQSAGGSSPEDGVLSQKQSLFRERGEIHRALIGSQESKALSSGARNEASP